MEKVRALRFGHDSIIPSHGSSARFFWSSLRTARPLRLCEKLSAQPRIWQRGTTKANPVKTGVRQSETQSIRLTSQRLRRRNSGSGSLCSQTSSNHFRSSRARGPAWKSTLASKRSAARLQPVSRRPRKPLPRIVLLCRFFDLNRSRKLRWHRVDNIGACDESVDRIVSASD
jgi:hypothetical protein